MRPLILAIALFVAACGDPDPKSTNNEPANNTPVLREPDIHRAKPLQCDNTRPAGVDYTDQELGEGSCTSDADCTDGDNGRCLDDRGTSCTYDECFSDDDCPAGAVCECEGGFHSDANACITGNCVTDADCGEGGYCSPSLGGCGHYSGYVGYFCHTADDECVNDADCASTGGFCAFDPGVGHWLCSNAGCDG